ncbi:PREDICTED: cryptic protein-like [Chrysochloris asiatica]|uniref:Cryptic protein-like n=1 Tax=Chrysochloris asiatica TaxID=185453 RepID=A0A9B0X3I6_CHRAS|nr:PREDICTED: cryptic protein-like [Chrysochloris asiatica]
MIQGSCIRLLIIISVALQIIHLGNSYQQKHKGGKEAINNATTQKPEQETLNWTLNNFSEVNGSSEGWRQPPESPLQIQDNLEGGTQGSRLTPIGVAPQSRCCMNGGTCVLGSFCACPRHFTGRQCEHDLRRSECGALAHGTWTVRSCRLCRCVYGALYCLARQTQGLCGRKSSYPPGNKCDQKDQKQKWYKSSDKNHHSKTKIKQ